VSCVFLGIYTGEVVFGKLSILPVLAGKAAGLRLTVEPVNHEGSAHVRTMLDQGLHITQYIT